MTGPLLLVISVLVHDGKAFRKEQVASSTHKQKEVVFPLPFKLAFHESAK